jgi:hypothetical protein
MKTITIGFSKSKKFMPIGSWLIRLYDQTPYSHVYIKFRSQTIDRTLIYEAVGSGIRFIGAAIWDKHAEEVASFDIEIAQCNYVTLLQYCVDNAGTEYGYMQNLGVPLSKLFNLKTNPFQTGKNCSEVVAEILSREGYESLNLNLVTPKDIFNMLSKKATL